MAGLWTVGAAVEFPYHLLPAVAAAGRPKLYVIGDSVAAGLRDKEETWPRLLPRSRPVEVADLSHVGRRRPRPSGRRRVCPRTAGWYSWRSATLDSAHLAGAGHERMAEAVWAV